MDAARQIVEFRYYPSQFLMISSNIDNFNDSEK